MPGAISESGLDRKIEEACMISRLTFRRFHRLLPLANAVPVTCDAAGVVQSDEGVMNELMLQAENQM